ncbi:microcyclamide/patellamide family RiPP [Trichodesmium erythraeum]|uniref:microcyclamide/patellamide family RiPP n=1 Tax=Trichodesmium erythraeum TaxID=1206 RepID=UPI00003C9DE4|nr:microcyclamide/patellamide family RiPP [Trichodesmium erythraeum GBRTRLIN201]
MGKKNIQPNSSQPVFRSLVARPALEELREENLTEGNQGHGPLANGPGPSGDGLHPRLCSCSYDGDDE